MDTSPEHCDDIILAGSSQVQDRSRKHRHKYKDRQVRVQTQADTDRLIPQGKLITVQDIPDASRENIPHGIERVIVAVVVVVCLGACWRWVGLLGWLF